MTVKIEKFYQLLNQELSSALGDYEYKGINVVPLKIQFYLNTIINSAVFIHEIEKLTSDNAMKELVEVYYDAFFIKKSIFQKTTLVINDIFRYTYHQFFHKSKKTKADFFIFITNKKFFSYTKLIKEALEQKGKNVEFIIWDLNDLDNNKRENIHLPITNFPSFWKKDYLLHYDFVTLVDRANGFLPLLTDKKVIIIEGDVEAQHVLGKLGKINKFKTYCLQWGFLGKTVSKSGWRDIPFDKFLVWGDFFAENFRKYNPELQIVSCGHPILLGSNTIEKGKVILFAVQKEFEDHISTDEVINFIHFAAKTAAQMPDYKIIIRSHPDFEIPDTIKKEYLLNKNIVWHDYKNFSLNQSFEEAKYCVSISSTVSLESIAYGCYPLYLKINDLPLQIHQLLSENSEFNHVFNFENFVAGIHNLDTKNFKMYLANFKKILYINLGPAAVNSIVSELNL